jgi:hypothetical protein
MIKEARKRREERAWDPEDTDLTAGNIHTIETFSSIATYR